MPMVCAKDVNRGHGATAPLPTLRVRAGLPALRCQLERRKIKTRGHRATDQRPVAGSRCSLPSIRWNDALRFVAGGYIRPQLDYTPPVVVGDLQDQRRAGVIVPDLHRIDAMPVRAFA